MGYKINVLLLTHNRPEMFKECLKSFMASYDELPFHRRQCIQLTVLCDDGSISSEDCPEMATFIDAKETSDISNNYKTLFESAISQGSDYSYYLEDDDLLFKHSLDLMLDAIRSDRPIYLFQYKMCQTLREKLSNVEIFKQLKITSFSDFKHYSNISKEKFIESYNDEHFQLGMLLFKTDELSLDNFPKGRIMYNDYQLFKNVNGRVQLIFTEIFQQRFSHGTNISDQPSKHTD